MSVFSQESGIRTSQRQKAAAQEDSGEIQGLNVPQGFPLHVLSRVVCVRHLDDLQVCELSD